MEILSSMFNIFLFYTINYCNRDMVSIEKLHGLYWCLVNRLTAYYSLLSLLTPRFLMVFSSYGKIKS